MKRSVPFSLLSLLLLILAACAAQPQTVEVTRVVTETITEVVEMEGEVVEVEVTRVVAQTAVGGADANSYPAASNETFAATAMPLPTATVGSGNPSQPDTQSKQAPSPRMIIKTGELEMNVKQTETAVDEVTDTILAAGGYIVSQRVWESGSYKYATMSVGVPVAEFERLMQAIGTLGEVTNEVASGQDVTDEFVDLESRLGNLLATQDRLRTFLEEAKNVEEILAVNKELSQVEEELEVIQGRMTFLADRAAFSTINITLNPIIPPAPTPTPTAIPTAAAWSPGSTAQLAAVNLQESAQNAADFTIYNTIACGPWLLLAGVILYFSLRAWRRFRHGRRTQVQRVATSEK